MVKYLVLVYGNEEVWGDPAVDVAALIREVDAFNASLRESGELVSVEGLVTAPRAIRSQGGVPVVSDGPYLEAKEHVGSFFVLDVAGEDRALEIARSYPALRYVTGKGGGPRGVAAQDARGRVGVTYPSGAEDLLRDQAPQVLGALVRRHGDFAGCEDAVQEALLAAHDTWASGGVPDQPRAWLVTVATRRLIDAVRADAARERREAAVAHEAPLVAPAADEQPPERDDSLALLFLCCHPAVTPPAQVALTLRAAGGLTTAEVARALLLPEPTVAQRISRAKAAIRADGARIPLPDTPGLLARLDTVHHVLYLIFNEGYTASSGPTVHRPALCAEALRLTRRLHKELPSASETTGLLALMLLADSRRAARQTGDGVLVPLAEQDRAQWDRRAIAEGCTLVEHALSTGPVGPYQLQAAIAALHAEARTSEETDFLLLRAQRLGSRVAAAVNPGN